MKQTIRISTFETNSSSYHSISIHKVGNGPKLTDIEIGKPTVLDGKINYKTIAYTDSYTFTSRTKLDKANMLCRYFGYTVEDWAAEQPGYDEKVGKLPYGYDRVMALREFGLNCPLLTAIKKVIEEYTDSVVIFKFADNKYEPFFEDRHMDNDYYLYEILQIKKENLFNEDVLMNRFKNIIFNDEIEITEEYSCNE